MILTESRFGWVNASYVYGMSFLPMHMRRALGTLTPWETYERATEVKLNGFEDGVIREGEEPTISPVEEHNTAIQSD